MPDIARWIIFLLGIAVLALGVVQAAQEQRRTRDQINTSETSVKILGLEFRAASSPLALIVFGLVAMVGVWMIPADDDDNGSSIESSGEASDEITDQSTTTTLSMASTTRADEAEETAGKLEEEISIDDEAGSDSGYVVIVLEAAPIAFWLLGDTSGDGAEDKAGRFNGTQINGPLALSANDSPLPGLVFDADRRQRIATEFNPADSLSEHWTLEFLMKAAPGDEIQNVIGGWDNGAMRRWYVSVLAKRGSGPQEDDEYEGGIAIGVGGSRYKADIAAADGAWHHIAVVFVPSEALYRVYVDGCVESEAKIGAGSQSFIDKDVSIGATWFGEEDRWDSEFDGELSSIAVYGRALDVDEVKEHSVATGLPSGCT